MLSRRAFGALLLHCAALSGDDARAKEAKSADRWLGGGVLSVDPNETLGQDRGIGGTGVIGTIRRFGSIVVNDLRVTFPADVRVSIDGRPATLRDLRIGHVVRVLARRRGGRLATRAIVARSEVVGPLDSREADGLVVLGQRVELGEGVALPPHRPGDTLAVSGLRRLDGTVVASLVERRPGAAARLSGPVAVGPDGAPAIGGIRVDGLASALVGRRVTVVGVRSAAGFRAASVAVEPPVPFAAADQLSVEAYVARSPEGLRLGSGLDVAAGFATLSALEPDAAVRAVVVVRPGPAGRLEARSVRVEHDPGGARRGAQAPGRPGKGGDVTAPGRSGGIGSPGRPGAAAPAGGRGGTVGGPGGAGRGGARGGGPGR